MSEKYQKRITKGMVVDQGQRAALRLWQKEIIRILNQPRQGRATERDLHEQFFSDVFVDVLGYDKRAAGRDNWTLDSEYVTDVDKTRPDGVLGFFTNDRNQRDVRVVIELKGPGTNLDLRQNRKSDRRTPIDQAFSYAHKYDNVEWVIVSNYSELRLYRRNSSKYALHFDLTKITDDELQLRLFFLLLAKQNLIARVAISQTRQIFADREGELQKISRDFYDDYKDIRLATAEHILTNKPADDVDHAVHLAQTILDRILFIAFLEDLHLIPANMIAKAYSTRNDFNPAPVWDNFKGLFRAMNEGSEQLKIPAYNGGLFQRNPDIQELVLDDALLERYKKLADYDFSSDLSVNILGSVFEQSITDLETIKSQLKRKDNKDSRRHDEGAYYTPGEVTGYIVERALDACLSEIREKLGMGDLSELTENLFSRVGSKRRQQHIDFWENYAQRLKRLKIVDPSCGSGAFLIAAFDYLLREGMRINRELDRLQAPRLFSSFDRDILKNILHGVDLSPEAVEITQLSLWLKIANRKDRLVSLDDSIRSGNSVAGFNWHAAFPDIMAAGGFDLVIGNPPYVRHELIKDIKPALKRDFKNYVGRADLYVYFYELGYRLLKPGGILGYISSNKWMRARYGQKLRQLIHNETALKVLIDLGETSLFAGATTYTNIIIFKKQKPVANNRFVIGDPPFSPTRLALEQAKLNEGGYNLESNPLFWSIREKMEAIGTPLKEWDIKINRGVVTGFNKAFIIDTPTKELLVREDPKSAEILKPLLRGRDVKKWHADWQGLWLIFSRRGIDIEQYPAIKRYLYQYYDRLKPRNNGKTSGRKPGDYKWYEIQDTVAYYRDFTRAKIVYAEIAQSGRFFLDTENYYSGNTSFSLTGKYVTLHFLVSFFNADTTSWYIKHTGTELRGNYIRFLEIYLKRLPIPHMDAQAQLPLIALSDRLHELSAKRYGLADRFLELLQEEFGLKYPGAKLKNWYFLSFGAFLKILKAKKITLSGRDKEDWHERFKRIKSEIATLDMRIAEAEQELNNRVNAIYGLTDEEVGFMEQLKSRC